MIVKQQYKLGGVYKDLVNLEKLRDDIIKVYRYKCPDYEFTLRFKWSDLHQGNVCSEIYNNRSGDVEKSLETLCITKDKGLIERMGDYLLDKMENGLK